MSDETKAAIDDAIRAHIEDESAGDVVTAWLAVVATAVPDDHESSGYWVEHPSMPMHATLGLVEVAKHYTSERFKEGE